jgi:endonuclease YncB( thermonuclease family)
MRHLRFVGGAVLAVVLAAILWHGVPTPTESPAPIASVPIPAKAVDATPPAPPPDAIAAVGPHIDDRHDTDAAETKKLPRLPSIVVAARPAHIVPEDEPIPPARPIDIRNPPGGAAPSAPAPAPSSAAPTEQAARGLAPRSPAFQIAGTAEASGAAALLVSGRPIRLFGVRPPSAADRCIPANSPGAPLSCTEQAHRELAARLAHNAGVSCRVPVPNAAGAAVCLDAQGVDLGGMLVAEGLALADPSQSYDYVGAESIARTQHRGLWLFR